MEGQGSKIVEMKPQAKETEQPKKLSYEQLEQAAHQLSEQVRQLYSQLRGANMNNMFKRLDYLFKVVENSHMFTQDFTEKCVNEIVSIMTIPEETGDNAEETPDKKEE